MRHMVIWLTIGMIALWIVVIGGTIMLDFDRVQQSNQATAELEWTYICDEQLGQYAEIEPIQGGDNFIGRTYNDVESTLIDEKGRALSDTYEELESIGDGYVRYEDTTSGVVTEGRENLHIGVLNDRGEELPEEEAMEILYREEEASEETQGGTKDTDNGAFEEHDDDRNKSAEYHVAKGDRKYVGIKDNAGNWLIPPAFDHIQLTMDQKYAVIKNGSNIGIAVLGGER